MHGQEMIVFLDGERPKTSLPDMTAAVLMLMIAADMRRRQPHHVLTEIAVLSRPKDQVEMVAHQTKGH